MVTILEVIFIVCFGCAITMFSGTRKLPEGPNKDLEIRLCKTLGILAALSGILWMVL